MNLWKSEKGSVVTLMAFLMVIMLGIMAIVIDVGMLYLEKGRLQKAMDASVLAGAQDLPQRADLSQAAAQQAAEANGVNASELQLALNHANTNISAQSSRTVDSAFAQILGFSQSTVSALAEVQLSPLSSGIGAIPLGVLSSSQLSFGTLIKLKVGSSDAGNFGALALTGPGARDYETDLRNGFQYELKAGDILDTQTGNITTPTQRAIEDRMLSCPSNGTATYTNYPADCPRVVLVPVYEPEQIDQNQVKKIRVVGFASFFIESVGETNEGAEVSGRFIQKAYPGASSSASPYYGTYGYKLIK